MEQTVCETLVGVALAWRYVYRSHVDVTHLRPCWIRLFRLEYDVRRKGLRERCVGVIDMVHI